MCLRRESNSHSRCGEQDFKSCVSTNFTTKAFATFKLPYELPTSPSYDTGLLSEQILRYATAVFVVPRSNDCAVGGGFEPPRSDSINDKLSRLCGQPIPFIYFVLCAHETSECVYLWRTPFHHPTVLRCMRYLYPNTRLRLSTIFEIIVDVAYNIRCSYWIS